MAAQEARMIETTIDETHDPARTSWVESANGHPDFPVQNLPFGMFSHEGGLPQAGVAIGDMILDLDLDGGLVPLLAVPPAERRAFRRQISVCLSDPAYRDMVTPRLRPASECRMHLPFAIGDYTDFYAGIHHARNVGALFRPDNPLLPNYKYVPVGYHGRASSVRPSGVAVTRPSGQRKAAAAEAPDFGPTGQLDYELELGIWIGAGNALGEPIPIGAARDHIAGFSLLNDWSARDLQAWEYQPLGPFLAKSFHTTVSPWVVTPEALAPFRTAQPPRQVGDPAPMDYLLDAGDQDEGALAIDLAVSIQSRRMVMESQAPMRVARSAAHHLYWTPAQLVTHHASNGCDLRAGDLIGTGTISGPERGMCGSLLEATLGGREPIRLPTGETRYFLEDGDTVFLSGTARAGRYVPIGFGPCSAQIKDRT
jgi:fumarylacetoacetase